MKYLIRLLTHIQIRKVDSMERNIGVTKEIDKNGRLVIPKKMRELFNLENTVELIITADGVLVRNPEYILTKKKSRVK